MHSRFSESAIATNAAFVTRSGLCLGWAERMGSISNGQELAITDIFFRSEIGFDEGAKGLSPIGFNIITGEQRELVYSVFTFVVYHYGS